VFYYCSYYDFGLVNRVLIGIESFTTYLHVPFYTLSLIQ
jgi:hypothetical protein